MMHRAKSRRHAPENALILCVMMTMGEWFGFKSGMSFLSMTELDRYDTKKKAVGRFGDSNGN
jgi:hypothetical protein